MWLGCSPLLPHAACPGACSRLPQGPSVPFLKPRCLRLQRTVIILQVKLNYVFLEYFEWPKKPCPYRKVRHQSGYVRLWDFPVKSQKSQRPPVDSSQPAAWLCVYVQKALFSC
jgi:hypothetical protein